MKGRMELILIYGPPGVGKLSVARCLERRTGYRLLHTHLIVDLASVVFPRDALEHSTLSEHLRLRLINEATKADIPGLIVTFALGAEHCRGIQADMRLLKKMIATVEAKNGEVHLIRLFCSTDELRKRIADPQRRRFGKICSYAKFLRIAKNSDVNAVITLRPGISIDTTKLKPYPTARIIQQACGTVVTESSDTPKKGYLWNCE